MDFLLITDIFKDNPGGYFVLGLLVGYGIKAYLSAPRGKRPGRYQAAVKRSALSQQANANVLANDPYFEWADAAVKTLTTRRDALPLNQSGKEV